VIRSRTFPLILATVFVHNFVHRSCTSGAVRHRNCWDEKRGSVVDVPDVI